MGIIDHLFLVKKIVSRAGKVHFRRWRLIETPWFAAYVHEIAQSDQDRDPHDHPWDFVSFVLRGGYTEKVWDPMCELPYERTYRAGSVVHHRTLDFHQLTLLGDSAWTFVVTGPRKHPLWGYLTEKGWVDHLTYRAQKNAARPEASTSV